MIDIFDAISSASKALKEIQSLANDIEEAWNKGFIDDKGYELNQKILEERLQKLAFNLTIDPNACSETIEGSIEF